MFDYNNYFDEFLNLYENDINIKGDKSAVAKFLIHKYGLELEGKTLNAVRLAMSTRLNKHYADREIIIENVKLKKEKQKAYLS